MIPPRLILAPVDFSECSRVSLAFAARLAQQCGAALHVLHAESPLLEAAARSRAIDLPTEADTELRAFMASTYPAANGLALYRVVSGSPVSAICEAAAAHRADLIVVGPHGLSRLARAVLGSTTEGVLLRTSTDVMVVPPSWTAPAADVPGLSGIGPVVVGVRDVATARPAVETGKALAGALGTRVEAVRVVGEEPSDAVPVDSVLVKFAPRRARGGTSGLSGHAGALAQPAGAGPHAPTGQDRARPHDAGAAHLLSGADVLAPMTRVLGSRFLVRPVVQGPESTRRTKDTGPRTDPVPRTTDKGRGYTEVEAALGVPPLNRLQERDDGRDPGFDLLR